MDRSYPVAISGGRDYQPTPDDLAAFWRIWDRIGATELHHGDCNGELFRKTGRVVGVDQAVAAEVRRLRPEIRIVPHPANWYPDWWRGPGPWKAAGPKRNREMTIPCYALIHFFGGRGTQTAIDAFRRSGRHLHSILDEVVASWSSGCGGRGRGLPAGARPKRCLLGQLL